MSGLQEFLDRFDAFYSNIKSKYKFGLEIRNPNYLKKSFFECIKENKLAMVFLHGYYMPFIWETFQEYKDYLKDTVVIHLHGPDRSGIEKITGSNWCQIVAPKDEELNKVAEIVHYFKNKKVDAHLNVNNHFEGSAPLTIKKLQNLL